MSGARLVVVLVAGGLLGYGSAIASGRVATVGAALFLVGSGLQLVQIRDASRRYRAGARDDESPSTADRMAGWVETAIAVLGLAGTVMHRDVGLLARPGLIVWVGYVAIWFASGAIIREVAGIPLRFGYGGWHVYRPRPRHGRAPRARHRQRGA